MTTPYRASAPGSLMLMGEHAVLWGAPCIVAAVDQRLKVTLTPRVDQQIVIDSAFGQEKLDLNHAIAINPNGKHQFIEAALAFYQQQWRMEQGFNLTIHSEIANGKGLGSSAAVVAATQQVLMDFYQHPSTLIDRIMQGRAIVQSVQGMGSGADIAASILGGIIRYQVTPAFYECLAANIPLTVLYCGYKTPTAVVIKQVQQRRQQQPDLFAALEQQAISLVQEATTAIQIADHQKLGQAFEGYAVVMQQMGVEDQACAYALNYLRQQRAITGAKISGSGLGDCVIGCGSLTADEELPPHLKNQKMQFLPVKLTSKGVDSERI